MAFKALRIGQLKHFSFTKLVQLAAQSLILSHRIQNNNQGLLLAASIGMVLSSKQMKSIRENKGGFRNDWEEK